MQDNKDSKDLLNITTDLFENRPIKLTLKKVSEETGIPYNWVMKFSSGKQLNPSFRNVVALLEYLSGKKLVLTSEES